MSKSSPLPDPDLDAKLDDAFGDTASMKAALTAVVRQPSITLPAPPTQNLAEALAIVQASIPEVIKAEEGKVEKDGKFLYKYSYADLGAVTRAILPRLGAVGLSWITMPTMVDGKFVLVYRLMHASGDFLEGTYPLPAGQSPQQTGSAITYARRYCLCSVTGVAPADDDDAAEAQAAHKRAQEGFEKPVPELSRFEQETGLSLLAVPTAEQRQAAGPVLMRQSFQQAVDFSSCLNEHQVWGRPSDGRESPTWTERMTARIADEVEAADDGETLNALWALLKAANLYTPEVAKLLKDRGAAVKERNAKAYDTLVQQITTATLEDMVANPSPVADSVEAAHRLGRITHEQQAELLELGKERYNRLKREQNVAEPPVEQ